MISAVLVSMISVISPYIFSPKMSLACPITYSLSISTSPSSFTEISFLVSEDTYTSVNYVPDEDTINQLVISYGDREDYMYNGSERFSFTFYENDFYRLKDITKQERFSNECFLKIKITKLWVWKSELKNGTFINNYKFEKLERSIQTLLGKEASKEFMPYIKQKVIDGQLRGQDEKIVETKEIGNYIINTYAHEGARVEFYISEK